MTNTVVAPVVDHTEPADTVSNFLLSRSIARYDAHLSSLASQLTYHISVLEKLISELQASLKLTKHTVTNVAGVHENFLPSSSKADVDAERGAMISRREARNAELKRRGEEWKAGRGRRFEAKRIEVLYESVLKELSES